MFSVSSYMEGLNIGLLFGFYPAFAVVVLA